MGQNVNYLLGGQSQMLGADPELYRQQLIQQEQQRIAALPAQSQLGAQLGGLLGRGIGNIANDRGFFEVTNPVLQKLTQIQSVYDTSMKEADPNDPMSFYTTLQKNFSSAGLGQQALMAATEAKKFEDMNLKTEAAKTALYKSNPQLLDTQIAKARDSGDNKLADQLAQQRGQIQVQIDLDRAKEVADIAYKNAATEAQRAQASKLSQDIESGKFDWKVINDITGTPTSMAKIDKKTGETTYEPIPASAIARPGAAPVVPPKTETPGSWKLVPNPGAK
jgi:Flp pilus assembly protein TadG